MAESMQSFVVLGQEGPDKRAATERREDFSEVYRELVAQKAGAQASRCAQCGVPFCQYGCPLQNNIPDWLRLTAEGRLQEAYDVSAATNVMPEICGRICPQDRLCEAQCVIEQFSAHGAVTIGAVEKFLTENAFENGWVAPLRAASDLGQSVGIVGAGPAGLAAAEKLRLRGYGVTIYDRHDRPGGLLIYGIPSFKLEKHIVARRTERLAAAGVVFRMNCDVGVDISFDDLRARHDALIIATGVYAARALNAPSVADRRYMQALDYLIAANRVGLGDTVAAYEDGAMNARAKRVVVIGGGDTAMDCVRTAVRQGAKSVSCLYRRDRANMPGSRREVANAEEEGVVFDWLAAPVSLRAGAKALTLKAERMRLGAPDASGRRAPEPVPGSDYAISADLVIAALGFDPEDLPEMWSTPELKTTRWNTLRVDPATMQTNLPGVFAAGDIVRGASLVVWAIREGVDAAEGVDAYLKARASIARVAAQ